MSRKKSGQATRSAKPKRRLRKLLVLALLGGIATAVAKKLGGSAPAVTAPPAAPRPTAAPATPAPTDIATEPAVEDVAPKKPAPNKSDPTEPPTDEAAIERLETEAPVETPAPAEVVTDESLENTSENPAIPADSLTSFFDEVLTENEQAKNTRKR